MKKKAKEVKYKESYLTSDGSAEIQKETDENQNKTNKRKKKI